MADNDDDLEAFFDEVSAAEVEATTGEDEARNTKEEIDDQPPLSKKQKTSHSHTTSTSKPKRPLGVVVAASSSVPSTKPVVASSEPVGTRSFASEHEQLGNTKSESVVGPQTPNGAVSISVPPPPPNRMVAPPLPPGPPPPPSQQHVQKPHKRSAAGSTWVDPSLDEWPENDYRIFVGNLSKDVTDEMLLDHFQTKYTSVAKAKIVRDNKTGMSKGFGFVSMLQPLECARAIREQDQTWLSSRPIRVKRSDWKERDLNVQRKKEKKRRKQFA